MSTRVFSIASDTVVRTDPDGSSGQGCGHSKHLYVGRYSSKQYKSFLKFNLDFSGMATIQSAVLNLYNDEGDTLGTALEPGSMPIPSSSDHPEIGVYRLTDSFTEGSNADGHFDSSDYTTAGSTTSGGVHKVITKGADLLNTIDITAIVKSWAPTSVAGGGKKTNYGIVLKGSTDTKENWSGWSEDHTGGGGASERPSITVTYTLGATKPNVPSVLTPAGTVPSVSTFEGNFSDTRPTDTLQSTDVQVFDGGHSGTASASTDNITATAHGLNVGDIIYFTSLTGGAGLTTFTPYYVRVKVDANTFRVSTTLTGASINITTNYSALTWSRLVAEMSKVATESERVAAHFIVPKPDTLQLTVGSTYRWRARYTDQEGQVSDWTAFVSFVLSNTPPNPPVLSPISGSSYSTFNLVKFEGGLFTDSDGDLLMAHQIQLSPFAPGSPSWDEADGILWDTGQSYEAHGATRWTDYYSGRALTAGTYYWRARQWDNREGVSSWTYATIVLTADFNPDPGSYDNVQVNPHAPWRILIRNLLQADGVTPTVGRGPGQLVAVFEEAKNVGASIVYNSPGELHFTLLKDDEQISEVEPKQTHYAVEFYSGDGWQEKYAGVIWDVDATETDVVFKGIDYLALYDTVIDERYDPLKPNKSYTSGGSYYSNVSISTVITDQLNRAKALTDSWVGFIAIGSIATMAEKVTVYSTMQPVLSFVAGLIDSHRQGQGIRTRMKVVKTTTGTYQLQIIDNPGVIRSDLALYYGELVQGYRLIVFGDNWANVQHVVGRNRDGVKVVYQTISGKAFQPSTSIYGRIATVAVMDGVQDQSDLARRGLQAAIQSAKLGKNIAIGLRTLFIAPLQGWDVCDIFPVKIDDGAINTDNLGSGYWAAYAAAWEATDIGEQSLIITLMPREDSSAPDPDLIPSRPVSTQPEWQLGWKAPNPITSLPTENSLLLSLDTGFFMDDVYTMDSSYTPQGDSIYVDMSTGNTYELQGDGTWALVTGQPTLLPPTALSVTSRKTLTDAGVTVTNVNVTVLP